MSLIQEALRRQREEGGNTPSVPPAAAPASPPPRPLGGAMTPKAVKPPPLPGPPSLPPPPATAEGQTEPAPDTTEESLPDVAHTSQRRSFMSVLLIILLVLVVGAAGVGLVFFAYKQLTQAKDSQQLVKRDETARPAPTAAPAEQASTDSAPATDGAAATATEAAAPPQFAEVPVPAATPAVPVAVAGGLRESGPRAWPFLKVTGVIGKGLRGAATINGRIVAVGELIEGVEVSSIGEYGAKLEYEGETRFIKVGSTVE